ncbi:hypothetical protein JP0166_03030 [Helicobacter pylori]
MECLKVMFNSINRYISKILRNKTLSQSLPKKKPKSLKSKDFKKAVVFKKDSPNTRDRAIES